jgi:hypothetical protein
MFALNGTLMALDVLGVPFLGVPMMAQFRHDTKLISLEWFGKLDYIALKWSTAGDFMVNEGGRKVVVNGKSANAPLRTAAGVYCNVRPYGGITSIRFMPGLPYSQDKKKFNVDPKTGHPLRDEHPRRPHGLRRAAVSQDGARDRTDGPRGDQAYPGAGRRGQRRHHALAPAGHEVQAQAPVHGGRLRGTPRERECDRGAPSQGLQGRHGELGRRRLRTHLRHQLRPAPAQLATFDKIYGAKRPRYIDGYKKLKEAIRPWGA